jgi:hypothetical protein
MIRTQVKWRPYDKRVRLYQRDCVVHVLHAGWLAEVLAAGPRRRGGEFFVSPKSRDAGVALSFDLRQDLIEPGIPPAGKRKDR